MRGISLVSIIYGRTKILPFRLFAHTGGMVIFY